MIQPGPRPFPPAVEHPLFKEWNERSYRDDLRPYGAHFRLHHYTSCTAVLGILEAAEVWATDATHLNDTTELAHGLPICCDAIGGIRDRKLLPYLGPVITGLEERFRCRTFVACFSSRNDLASQWQDYADRQRGYAIAFDNLCLTWLWAPPALRLMPVEYGPTAQRSRAQRAVDRAVSDISRLRLRSAIDFAYTVHSRLTLLGVELFYMCSSFKSWEWRGEREWRLIYTRMDNDDADVLPIQTGESGKPYVSLDLTRTIDGQPRPIYAAIRQGPRANRSADLIQRYLREHHIAVEWERQPPFT